ncbi:MAG: sugar ABC transporter permease [Gorillibacterium sp.]|nr:sugar ABC transporter permease [Gorillibacterium sp.]
MQLNSKTEHHISKKGHSFWRKLLSQWDIQLMVFPAILFVIVFSYIPMWGVLIAFKDYNMFEGFLASPWVGFKHFSMFFNSTDFWTVMRNTIIISFLKLFIGFPAPIILALMLNEIRNMVFKRVLQTISYLPHFLSMVIVSGMVFSMLSVDNGSLNILLLGFNWVEEPINWLSIPEYFWAILVSTSVWKEIGFGAIVYLAAIAGIDPHLYEAASLDGASHFKQVYLITIPGMAPVISIFLILAVGGILNAGFEDILLLTNNGTNGILKDVSNVIDTYVYHVGVLNQRYSYATAAGMFKAIVSISMLLLANFIAKKAGRESLW